jgi:glycopeptide antibiotics resistance protein
LFSRSHTVPLRWLAWFGVALAVAWLLSITLLPGRQSHDINLIPFHYWWPTVACLLHGCPRARREAVFLFVDVLGNLLMVVPFGAALAAATFPPRAEGRVARNLGSRWWFRNIAVGFLFSVGIELTQLLVPRRTTDVDDVILNTLGTTVGIFIVWGSYKLSKRATGCSLLPTDHLTLIDFPRRHYP